jgi:hypothetical protein
MGGGRSHIFFDESEDREGSDIYAYLSSVWADILDTSIGSAKTFNEDFIIEFDNDPTLEALGMQARSITGRSDLCERVNLLKALRRAWAWTNDAFDVGRENLIFLPPQASKRNFTSKSMNDIYDITALQGYTVAFD